MRRVIGCMNTKKIDVFSIKFSENIQIARDQAENLNS